MTDNFTSAQIIEAHRRDILIHGSKAIDARLGESVRLAFDAGYSADQVHAMLSAGKAILDGPNDAAPVAKLERKG